MSACPKCDAEIHNSTYCGCGWKRPKGVQQETHQHMPCAHETCATCAIIRYKVKTGWADFCYTHYIVEVRKEQDAQMDAKGYKRGYASNLAKTLAAQYSSKTL